MGQFGHIGETESGGTPFDGVCTPEDGIEFFVVGGELFQGYFFGKPNRQPQTVSF